MKKYKLILILMLFGVCFNSIPLVAQDIKDNNISGKSLENRKVKISNGRSLENRKIKISKKTVKLKNQTKENTELTIPNLTYDKMKELKDQYKADGWKFEGAEKEKDGTWTLYVSKE